MKSTFRSLWMAVACVGGLMTVTVAQAQKAPTQEQLNQYFADKTRVIFECATVKAPAGWNTIVLQLAKKGNGYTLFSSALMNNHQSVDIQTCGTDKVSQPIYDLANLLTPEQQKQWQVLFVQLQPNRAVTFQALTKSDVARLNNTK